MLFLCHLIPQKTTSTNIYATHTSPDKENLDLPSTPSKPPLAGTGSVVDSPSTTYLEEKTSTFPRQTDAGHFTVAEKCTLYLNPDLWHNLFSKCILRKDGTQKLPTSWTDSISSVMAAAIPSCCINFKVYKGGEFLAKFWYYCTIEGCELKGTASLNSSFYFEICYDKTKLQHIKGRKKSFQSR